MDKLAKPAHEQVCTYCQLYHPISMYVGTPIEGMARVCAELKITREEKEWKKRRYDKLGDKVVGVVVVADQLLEDEKEIGKAQVEGRR